jgi:hypothetical protein
MAAAEFTSSSMSGVLDETGERKFDQETLSRARARASRVVVVDRPSMLGRGPATGPAEARGAACEAGPGDELGDEGLVAS